MHYPASADSCSKHGADPSDDPEHGHLFSHYPSAESKSAGMASLAVKTATDHPRLDSGTYRLRELTELDALAATYVTGEQPKVFWEDTHARFRFETLNEALEAMRDPLIQGFFPREQVASTVIEEVREFSPYSACFVTAWKIVDKLADQPFTLIRNADLWIARFGEHESPGVVSPTVAICVAALRAKGIDIELPAAAKTAR